MCSANRQRCRSTCADGAATAGAAVPPRDRRSFPLLAAAGCAAANGAVIARVLEECAQGRAALAALLPPLHLSQSIPVAGVGEEGGVQLWGLPVGAWCTQDSSPHDSLPTRRKPLPHVVQGMAHYVYRGACTAGRCSCRPRSIGVAAKPPAARQQRLRIARPAGSFLHVAARRCTCSGQPHLQAAMRRTSQSWGCGSKSGQTTRAMTWCSRWAGGGGSCAALAVLRRGAPHTAPPAAGWPPCRVPPASLACG